MSSKPSRMVHQFISRYIPQGDTQGRDRLVIYSLVKDGLLDEAAVRKFMIYHDFPEVLRSNGGNRMQTYADLAAAYHCSAKLVEQVIYKYRPAAPNS